VVGAGLATLLASCFGVVVAGLFVWKKFNALVSWKSVARILVACIAVFFFSGFVPGSGLMVVFKYFILTVLYFAALVAMRELKYFDFLVLKNVLRK